MKTLNEFKSVFKDAPFGSEFVRFYQIGNEVTLRYSFHMIPTPLLMFCAGLREKYGFAFYVTTSSIVNSSFVDLVVYTTLS